MIATVAKWGNSLALRIPNGYARDLSLSEGSSVDVVVTGDTMVIRSRVQKKRYALDDLVSAITPKNRHAEAEYGAPVGNEAW